MLKTLLFKRGLRGDRFLTRRLLSLPGFKNTIVFLDTYAFLRSQYWPYRKIREIQLERIKDIVIHSSKKIPFWQDRFSEVGIHPDTTFSWDDFLRIPITKKTDFKKKPETYFTDHELFSQDHITSTTSGSTAEPLQFFQDHYYELRSLAVCRRILLTAGHGRLLPLIQIRARHRRGFADKKSWWFYAYNHNHLKYRVEKLYQATEKLGGPFILYGFSSYIIEIARLCGERKIPLWPAAIIVTGEGLQPGQREFIESHLKTEVFNCYVTNELGWLAQDCENHNLHINSEFAYIEITDKNGGVLENGQEGRVVVTTFDNKIMPFIRYDTGDLGTISLEPCDCGKTLPRLKIIGRQTDIIKLADNRSVPLLDVLTVFWRQSKLIRQYQLVQKSLDEFVVKIIPENTVNNDQLIEIANHLRRNLHPGIKVEFELVEEIASTPTGKKINFKSLTDTGKA